MFVKRVDCDRYFCDMLSMLRAIPISMLSVLVFSSLAYSAQLCEDQERLLTDSADDLRMEEHLFVSEKALNSMIFLEEGVWKLLKEKRSTDDVIRSEQFYVGYPNSLRIVKGALLRQNAIIARQNVDLMAANNSISSEKLKIAQENYQEARDRFCEFLDNASYVD